jgi:hypothetical protein
MIIYDGQGEKRKQDPRGADISFHAFYELFCIPGARIGYNYPVPRFQDLSGWYQCEQDEKLVQYALAGNIDELRKFITHDDPAIAAANKKYLADLRFDTDGIATRVYKDTSGWCLLNVAAACGNTALVDFLVDEVGMDVNTMCYGVPPIFCCFPSMHDGEQNCNPARIAAAKAFIAHGANLSHTTKTFGTSLMHTACSITDHDLRYEGLELLCANIPNPNLVDSESRNALHFLATPQEFPAMERHIRLLVRSGVDASHEDKIHRKPGRDLDADGKRKLREICAQEEDKSEKRSR